MIFVPHDSVVINKLNFVIKKGDKIVVHGRNGAGKSILFRLILRLMSPMEGGIFMDGLPISKIKMKSYRSLISYIPQRADLFDDTVYNNLRYGNEKSYSEIIEECRRLNIHKEILKLSSGYNTVVGERGELISGGLRQKVYCARAMLKDSFIYLFDEPISSLDSSSAALLIDIILSPKFSHKTFLVICNNPNIIEKFPKSLHLD
jgi:ABC-type multidrug transport system fused ATPase/permease subunit